MNTPVALDAMGGDYGPRVVVEGAVDAAEELGISTILVGDRAVIESRLAELGADNNPKISICHASESITMEDSPSTAIRGKPDSSLRLAFELVRDGKACGAVSAGNTGAMMAAGLYVCGALRGIARPAIASLIPRRGDSPPTVLLDSGANTDCHAFQLVQFALMGSCYARSAVSLPNPKVALLSNGSELSKGTDVIRSAAVILRELEEINFVGYVEGRDIPSDKADVIVCDGFVGNVVLKTMEGAVELVVDSIKHYVEKSPRGKFGLWLAKPALRSLFRDRLDPSAYGGAPLLGLNGIGIVCHGSSSSRAIMNGVRVAHKFASDNLVTKMEQALSALEVALPADFQDGLWNRVGQRFDKSKRKKEADAPAEPQDVTTDETSKKGGV